MKTKSKNFKHPIVSLIAFMITVIINYASTSGVFTYNQKEISDMYRNFMTPESFAFSIWGVIYLLVLISLIYQFFLIKNNTYEKAIMDKFNLLFQLTCILNIIWNIAWVQNMIGISCLIIFLFSIVLAFINTHILKNKNIFPKIYPLAFAIYFGWLTVATVTNISAFLVKIEWNMFGLEEYVIACFMYLITAILSGFILLNIKNPVYNFPIVWAFYAIYNMLKNNPPKQPNFIMPYVVIFVIVLLIMQILYVFKKNNYSLLSKS